MFSWLRRKLRTGPAGRTDEVTPGGSRLYRYGGHEFDKTQLGVPGRDTFGFLQAREAEYTRMFGPYDQVFHELMPFVPHVDVFQFPPGHQGRDHWTLVTSGMSDLRMTVPRKARRFARAELIFYCSEPQDAYLELLRVMAHFPHDNKTWLGPGHTMPNGNPPTPFFHDAPELTSLVFLPSIVQTDASLPQRLRLAGDPVNLLWVVPISAAETQAKLDRGVEFLLELMDRNQHPVAFPATRKSYV